MAQVIKPLSNIDPPPTTEQLQQELSLLRQRLHLAETQIGTEQHNSNQTVQPLNTLEHHLGHEQNQPLLQEITRLKKESAVLHAVAQAIASSTHEDDLIEQITTTIGEALYPVNFGVLLLDPVTGSLQTHRSYRGKNVPVAIGQGVVGHVAASGEAWLIPDVSQEPAYIAVDMYTRSELCVPLKIGEQVIGVLNTESPQLNAYTQTDEQLLTIIAQQLAIGIHKIRLFADVMEALNREQGLSDIIRSLNMAPDMPSILASVVRMATELLKADAGLLGLLIDQQILSFYPYNLPHHVSLRPLPKGHGIAWQIVETAESFLLANYPEHPHAEHKWIRAGVKTSIGVPITAANSALGTLELFSFTPDKQFNHRDLKLAESIGRQAGIVLQNKRLYAEAQQRASMLATTLAKQEELDRSKNIFVQNISHELRTPLGIIYGHAELLESGGLGELGAEQFQSIQIIVRRARMLTDLLDDLSALLAAETQEFRRDPIDPSQLLHSVLVEFQVKAKEANLLLSSEIQDNLPWIMGDPTHLRRVFDNLLANAFKFTTAGGSIMVRMMAEGKDLVIEVADTGRGIPEDKIGRIFERFFQVQDEPKHRKQGTGLGLALVKEIIEAHRGQVSVQSVPGQGTTFQIWLPGQEPPPPIE